MFFVYVKVGSDNVVGLAKGFSSGFGVSALMFLWTLGSVWILEFSLAVGQFVSAYTVVLWFFTRPDSNGQRDAPVFPMMRGVAWALVYHTGSLAAGSFVLALSRPVRLLLKFIAKRDRSNSSVEDHAESLDMLSRLYSRFLEFLSQGAYIEVVLHSTDFAIGSVKSFKASVAEGERMSALLGSCWVFQLVGLVGIPTLAAFGCHLSIISSASFTSDTSAWCVLFCVIFLFQLMF